MVVNVLNWFKVLRAREVVGLEAELVTSDDLAVLVAKYTTDNPTETIDKDPLHEF